MNIEYLQIGSIVSSVLFGTLGGTGFRWMRIFLLPVILGIISLLVGFEWWRCLGMSICLGATLSLPYGEKTPYWLKFLLACSWSASNLLLGFSFWQIILPIVFIIIFKLSNMKLTAKIFNWKICEAIFLGLIGIIIANLIGSKV